MHNGGRDGCLKRMAVEVIHAGLRVLNLSLLQVKLNTCKSLWHRQRDQMLCRETGGDDGALCREPTGINIAKRNNRSIGSSRSNLKNSKKINACAEVQYLMTTAAGEHI